MRRDRSLIPLSHQHQHGLALSVLIDRGLKKDPSPENIAKLSRMVTDMAELELLDHFQIEEEVLFPAVRPSLADDAIVDELIDQHRDMERMIDEIASTEDLTSQQLLAFGDLLSRHIRTEERQLFQEIQVNVDEFRLAQLGKRIADQVHKTCPSTQLLPWQSR